jgi:hypothetical protein
VATLEASVPDLMRSTLLNVEPALPILGVVDKS